jgi:hypothetical protein
MSGLTARIFLRYASPTPTPTNVGPLIDVLTTTFKVAMVAALFPGFYRE